MNRLLAPCLNCLPALPPLAVSALLLTLPWWSEALPGAGTPFLFVYH